MAKLDTLSTKTGPIQAVTQLTPPPPGWLTRSPGLVLLHDWWGFDEAIRGHASRLGDTMRAFAIAPDYYSGKTVEEPNFYWGDYAEGTTKAAQTAKELDWNHAIDVVGACIAWIKGQRAVTPTKPGETMEYERYNGRIALVGFGLGGGVALAAASKLADPDIIRVVSFYGLPKPEFFSTGLKCKAQVHLVKGDEHAKVEDFEALKKVAGPGGASTELFEWTHNCEEGKDHDKYSGHFPARRGFLEYQSMVALRAWRVAHPFLRNDLHDPEEGRKPVREAESAPRGT